MAKKKSNKGHQQRPMSPARYMREKARTLPIDKCYIWPAEWKESGMAQLTVTRRKPNGHLVVGIFLVDTYCLGVKNTIVRHDVSEEELMNTMMQQNEQQPMEEISYEEAHNLIYGAVAYAEDAGIPRYKEFYPAAYVLEEDTEEIPLIEYEFGYQGKPYLIVGPTMREIRYLDTLRKNLGDGNFNYTVPVPLGDDMYIPDEDEEEYLRYEDGEVEIDEEYEEEMDPMLGTEMLDKMMSKMDQISEEIAPGNLKGVDVGTIEEIEKKYGISLTCDEDDEDAEEKK